MQKLLIYLMLLGVVFGCKKEAKPVVKANSVTQFISFKNTPDTKKINPEADSILTAWPEFQALQNSFEVMYRAENNEDLVLAIDDLLEKEKGLKEGTYPEIYNKEQIKSRQKVLRTFLLKVKASLAESTAVNEPIKQMLTARNAFRNQFNLIISNKLDTELILNEN